MKIVKTFFILLMISLPFIRCSKNEKISDPVKDSDGNIYKTIKIGAQLWMAENLKTSRLTDGTEIPLITDGTAWNNLTAEGYCWYNNEAATYKDQYGALYNGLTVSTGKICPTGWHVPSNDDWKTLRDFLGDSLKAGGKLKEAGTGHWLAPNKGDNSSGFDALPGGLRYFEGTFATIGTFAGFWSSDVSDNDEWFTGLYYADPAFKMDHQNRKNGFSIRCIKN